MRRLDWFLAAVVASFLIGALIIEAAGLSLGGFDRVQARSLGPAEVSIRRLVSHVPDSPIFQGDAG